MHRVKAQNVSFNEQDLIGAWEALDGDGIHGLHYRVLVFRREGTELWLDSWLPPESQPRGDLILRFADKAKRVSGEEGLTLLLNYTRRMRIERAGVETILVGYPGTTAGFTYFRRTAMPTHPDAKKK